MWPISSIALSNEVFWEPGGVGQRRRPFDAWLERTRRLARFVLSPRQADGAGFEGDVAPREADASFGQAGRLPGEADGPGGEGLRTPDEADA
jgi:hypothetical protein